MAATNNENRDGQNSNSLSRRSFLRTTACTGLVMTGVSSAQPQQAAKNKKTILVIGAHLDDCEIGAGGIIAKAVRKGHRVVLLNVASDYSTWKTTKGREKDIRQVLVAKAQEMGVEKRFLDYGYQQVAVDVETMRRVAEVVLDVRPNITFMHDRNERDRAPSDHATVGQIAEHAVRNANTLLSGQSVRYGREMYAYEVYPQRDFRPDVFIDITDVIEPVCETINFFGRLYAGTSNGKVVGKLKIEHTVKNHAHDWELALGHYSTMKLCTTQFRAYQCSRMQYVEAYRAVDPVPLGRRSLQHILED